MNRNFRAVSLTYSRNHLKLDQQQLCICELVKIRYSYTGVNWKIFKYFIWQLKSAVLAVSWSVVIAAVLEAKVWHVDAWTSRIQAANTQSPIMKDLKPNRKLFLRVVDRLDAILANWLSIFRLNLQLKININTSEFQVAISILKYFLKTINLSHFLFQNSNWVNYLNLESLKKLSKLNWIKMYNQLNFLIKF